MTLQDKVTSKEELRKQMRAARKDQGAREGADKSWQILNKLLRIIPWSDFDTIALYWPFGGEVDLRGLADPLRLAPDLREKTFLMPVIEGLDAPLGFHSWSPGAAMISGAYGIKVPQDGQRLEPQLLLVPLLGFDREGNRIGQGGGFYDRTLTHLKGDDGGTRNIPAVGLAFSFQECLNIASEDHDERLDAVVTEHETLIFSDIAKSWGQASGPG